MCIPLLVRNGYELSFASNVCHIHYGNDVVGMGIMVNGLYILELHESVRQRDVNVASSSSGKHSCNTPNLDMELVCCNEKLR